MPELPEVETIRRDLNKLIKGKKILAIESDSPKQVRPSPAAVKKAIVGTTIKKVDRRAKILLIELVNKSPTAAGSLSKKIYYLAVHLKLTGRLLVKDKEAPKDDWQRVTISLSGGQELRFCDLRKFGWIKILDARGLKLETGKFGLEPLTKEFTVDYLKKVLAKTSRPVKIVLMDQKKIAGIGNIYAAEALFLAKIDPRRPANKITEKEARALYRAIKKVLKAGIKYRGASDQYYLDALGRKGSYQEHFLVYGREGEKCWDGPGKVEKIKLGGRGTYFCPHCQK